MTSTCRKCSNVASFTLDGLCPDCLPVRSETLLKVVEKGTRRGTNWAIFKRTPEYAAMSKYARMKLFKELTPFMPVYRKGAIVKAAHGTSGLFCFANEKAAEEFIEFYDLDNIKVIKLRPLTRPTHINSHYKFVPYCGADPTQLIECFLRGDKHLLVGMTAPYKPGHVLVDVVKVLT